MSLVFTSTPGHDGRGVEPTPARLPRPGVARSQLPEPLLPADDPCRGQRPVCLRGDPHRGPVVDLLAVPASDAVRLRPECAEHEAHRGRPGQAATGGMHPLTRPGPAQRTTRLEPSSRRVTSIPGYGWATTSRIPTSSSSRDRKSTRLNSSHLG